MKIAPIPIQRWFLTSLCFAACLTNFSARASETLPGAVSDMIRDLGELRDISWDLMDEARKAHGANPVVLAPLNAKYIAARAAANSLIEQIQLETVARTRMDVKRYATTVGRTKELCRALTNEWQMLMFPTAKTRGAATPATVVHADVPGESMELAGKAVGLADGLLTMVAKNSKSFRELDAQQRIELHKLLEERKWKPLDAASLRRTESSTTTNAEPAGAKPAISNTTSK